jgi:hypothetical protein
MEKYPIFPIEISILGDTDICMHEMFRHCRTHIQRSGTDFVLCPMMVNRMALFSTCVTGGSGTVCKKKKKYFTQSVFKQ